MLHKLDKTLSETKAIGNTTPLFLPSRAAAVFTCT